jgi:hypothetical protein
MSAIKRYRRLMLLLVPAKYSTIEVPSQGNTLAELDSVFIEANV